MRHRKRTFKINRTSSHRRAMLANMACSLLEEGQIETSVTRGKEVRRLAEKMITLGKRGSLHARRQAISKLRQPRVVKKLFDDVAPCFQDRTGGYTRILRLGRRVGDAAEICLVQLVTEPVASKDKAAEPEQAAAETAPTAGGEAAVSPEQAAETGEDTEESVTGTAQEEAQETKEAEANSEEAESGEEQKDEPSSTEDEEASKT